MPQAQVAQIDEVGVSQNDPLDAPPNAGSAAVDLSADLCGGLSDAVAHGSRSLVPTRALVG
jgi:hypothetical protein